MDRLLALLDGAGLAAPLQEREALAAAEALSGLSAAQVYPRSIAAQNGVIYFLARREGGERRLGLLSRQGAGPGLGFTGGEEGVTLAGELLVLQLCLAEHGNALALRRTLPFTAPRTLGLAKSAGCGDRLGLATPGHVRAIRGSGLAPVFAQQSIREMVRTQRTPEQVLDDAMWGVFQEGWREGYGADADHLKTVDDVDACVRAGYTFYTIDPGDHVDNDAETADAANLAGRVEALPWPVLESSPADLRRTYAGRPADLGEGLKLTLSEEDFLRAAAKYGRAIAHTATLYRYLRQQMGGRPFELEMSVDETDVPTKIAEHWFVASELLRLGVRWVSLAPRYSGRFEKGVDYRGDLATFEAEIVQHVAIARRLGPYKLSLHSGSDKFSIYPLINRHAGDLVHLKTAGTSYLEALRTVAHKEPGLFREILAFAREHFEADRATYHYSAELARVADPAQLSDAQLPAVLNEYHTRQVLHMTFGSVLTARTASGDYLFRSSLYAILAAHEEEHYAALETHFRRHLESFKRAN
ncbi:MAG TPA: tagaturonate epimerase family protein [Anaerolineae bacterium]|nr:tagaturonate epimerase family protein [Anaerolineae bacterium]HOR01095.1 tagaturonate epimerase family protein [Anaerolineae bacterium]HPL29017.1 tagaturonate epimerase family protein [Anaerolineae bacterium]